GCRRRGGRGGCRRRGGRGGCRRRRGRSGRERQGGSAGIACAAGRDGRGGRRRRPAQPGVGGRGAHRAGAARPRRGAGRAPAASGRGARRGLLALLAGTAVAVVVVDQLSKAWAVEALTGRGRVDLVGELFGLRLTRNPGAAFSLATGSTWIFTILASIVVVVI